MSKPKSLTLLIVLGGSICLTLLFMALAWQAINEWEALWQHSPQAEQGLILPGDQPNSLESESAAPHAKVEVTSADIGRTAKQHLSDTRQLIVRWSIAWLAALGLMLLMLWAT